MKKMFIAALTAFALSTYTYAQDDEDEYEEDDAPARVEKKAAYEEEEEEEEAPAKASKKSKAVEEEEEDEAPAKASKKAPRAAVNAAPGFMGVGIDLVDAIDNGGVQKFYLTFALAPDMELSAILGFYSHGETSAETNGVEAKGGDDYTQLQLGVGFDYFMTQKILPISIGGEILYSSWGEDDSQITVNVLAGFRANLVAGLALTAKAGLGIDYMMWSEGNTDYTRLDLGLKTSVQFHWFFM